MWNSSNNEFTAPTIDASLGVGMVGGVKALYAVLLALVLGVGCEEKEAFERSRIIL